MLDTVIIAEKVNDIQADIGMRLTFRKARNRKPDNREDFETVTLTLQDDKWSAGDMGKRRVKLTDMERRAFDVLQAVLADEGEGIRNMARHSRNAAFPYARQTRHTPKKGCRVTVISEVRKDDRRFLDVMETCPLCVPLHLGIIYRGTS
jgi:hypothetical protein